MKLRLLPWLLAFVSACAFGQSAEQNLSSLSHQLLSGGVVPIAVGGTGATSQTAALINLLPSLTPGCLSNNGTTVSWETPCGGGTPGGFVNQLQYKLDGSSFGGISNVSGGILIGQTSGIPIFYVPSGDCTISASGVVTCTKTAGVAFAATATNSSFSALTSGTNTGTLTMGTGGSLTPTGTGIIEANQLILPGPAQCPSPEVPTGITSSGDAAGCFTPTGSGNVSNSGTPTAGQFVTWVDATHIQGATAGSNTLLGNGGGGVAALTPAQAIGLLNSATANAQTGTTYTLALTDENGEVTMNNAAANTLTIPPNSSVAFPIGTIITVEQLGAGTTSIALGAGVSVQWGGPVTYASLGGQYGVEQFQQVATNVWQLVSQQLGNTKFTVSGGTCSAAAATAGGARGGMITQAASGTVGNCTQIITPGGGLTAQNLWLGKMCDQTQQAVPCWGPSAESTTNITFTEPTAVAVNDVLTFTLDPQ